MCVGSKYFFIEIGFYELGKNNLAVDMCSKLKNHMFMFDINRKFHVKLYLLIISCNVTKKMLFLNAFWSIDICYPPPRETTKHLVRVCLITINKTPRNGIFV